MTKTVNINLLPWRAELREKQKKEFQTRSVLAGLLGAVAVLAGFMYFSQQLEQQQQVNEMIVAENAKLDTELKSLEGLDKRRADIIERMKLIDGLQGQRPVIVHIADNLVRITPQNLFFTKFQRTGDKFTIEGKAQDPNVVAELLRGLENSPWFRNAFMNSFVAVDETKLTSSQSENTTASNPIQTSVIQRPEIKYGQFVVTVDLDELSKSTIPTDPTALPVDSSVPTQSIDGQPAPVPQSTNAPVQQTVVQSQPVQQPANVPAQPAPSANDQVQPTPPANNQEAK